MFIVVYPIKYLIDNTILLLTIQIIVGAIIYIALMNIFKVEAFNYLFDIIKKRFKKNKEVENE